MSDGIMITGIPPAPLVSAYGTIFTSTGINLTYSQTATDVTISPGIGASITIPAASSTFAGMLDATRAGIIDGLHPIASSGLYSDLSGTPDRTVVIPMIIDGGGIPIVPGITRYFSIPFAATITGWAIMADQVGSIAIDIWKTPFVNYPPTIANSITAAALPTLVSAASAQQSNLIGWTTGINAGDVLGFHVISASAVTSVTVQLTGIH